MWRVEVGVLDNNLPYYYDCTIQISFITVFHSLYENVIINEPNPASPSQELFAISQGWIRCSQSAQNNKAHSGGLPHSDTRKIIC